jgi:hypothetical protein
MCNDFLSSVIRKDELQTVEVNTKIRLLEMPTDSSRVPGMATSWLRNQQNAFYTHQRQTLYFAHSLTRCDNSPEYTGSRITSSYPAYVGQARHGLAKWLR